jgi:aspartyl-tRNA(Asn)/glutamyl-tRNA(Gln) amidotransferase subunit A
MSLPEDIFVYINPPSSAFTHHGPLQGLSIAIQPNMSVQGWPTEAGSFALKGFTAIEDATVIERLKTAGATLVGSAHMSELGLGLNRDTASRILTEGRANAVLMTDMMGEGRIAAARAEAFGFKPTHGLVSRFGLIGLVPSMECFSILAHKAEDIKKVMDVIDGYDERDFSMVDGERTDVVPSAGSIPSIQSIGVVKECVESLDTRESKAFLRGIETLRTWGFAISEISLPDFRLYCPVHQIVGAVEASSSCGKYDGVRYGHRVAAAKNWNDMYLKSRGESFGILMKTYLFQGAYFQFENYAAFEKAGRIRARMVKDVNALFAGIDGLAFPTRRGQRHSESTPESIEDIYHECSLTLPVNVMGLPAIQMPGFIVDKETDYGLQIVGPRLSDGPLLSLAARLLTPSQGVES